jgi:thioredoxin
MADGASTEKVATFSDDKWQDEVLSSPQPVLVDFWAEWCAPCRMMAPTIVALATEFEGRARVGKLNVDENASTSEKYDIRGIPTVILFKGGEIKEQVVGVTSKENLTQLLERHLA